MYAAAARIRTESPVSGSALSRILRPPPAPLPAPPPPPRFLVVVQLVQQRQIVLLHALRFFARHIRAAHGKNPHRRLFRAFAGFDGHAIFVTRSVTRVT